ncbi:condensin complex protein MksE [Pseudomonas sp. A46]|nr:hypothetical protein [Pseudomonas sp. A46]
MPALTELFRLFLSGKHLNRVAEPALWAELEQQEAAYVSLFAALGYELRLDGRGFAWFHSGDASSNIGKISRQLALLFMVIFDAQANAGKALQRFTDWPIDSEWLGEVYKQQQEVLDAEGLGPDALVELLGRACSLGFARVEPAGWRLLPAVCRYLDHFEGLAAASKGEREAVDEPAESGMEVDGPDDEENA